MSVVYRSTTDGTTMNKIMCTILTYLPLNGKDVIIIFKRDSSSSHVYKKGEEKFLEQFFNQEEMKNIS